MLAAGNYRAFYCHQDYSLSPRMLAFGFVLYNMGEVLVYARCGYGLQARRGSIAYAKEEIKLERHLRELGLLNAGGALLSIVMRAPIRLAPGICARFLLSIDAAEPVMLRNRPRDLAADSDKMTWKELSMATGT